MTRRWTNLSAEARDLHTRILCAYLEIGGPPDGGTAAPALDELRARDLVFLHDGKVGAYPFAPSGSGHRVFSAGSSHWTICVFDAFGIAAMLGVPAGIETCCGACDVRIDFEATEHEVEPSPAEALVWAAVRDIGGVPPPASAARCRLLLRKPSSALDRDENGFALSASQAAQAGAAIIGPGSAFGNVLAVA